MVVTNIKSEVLCSGLHVGKPAATNGGRYSCCLSTERVTVSVNMCDLGVVVDSHLCFSLHITKIVRKAHQRANLIHRCFKCKDCDMFYQLYTIW